MSSLKAYIEALDENLDDLDRENLTSKAEDDEIFVRALDVLFHSTLSLSFPLPGFIELPYIKNYYDKKCTALEACTIDLSYIIFPYCSHDNPDMVLNQGFLYDDSIPNPHYFVETFFADFERLEIIPYSGETYTYHRRTKRWDLGTYEPSVSKSLRTDLWRMKDMGGRSWRRLQRKEYLSRKWGHREDDSDIAVSTTQSPSPSVTSSRTGISTLSSDIEFLFETTFADDFIADLLPHSIKWLPP